VFFAYLFMLLTGTLFETNLPTKITCGDIDLFFHNTKILFDETKSAIQFANEVLKLGGKYCVVSIKNWSIYSEHNYLEIDNILKEFRKIDPDHLGLWVLIIPHVSYPKLMEMESHGIRVIQTNFQILPATTEGETDEQRKITTHWLAVLKERLQPILTEYFDANVCYDINETSNDETLTSFTKLKSFQTIHLSPNKSSNNKVNSHESSFHSS